MYNVDKMDKMFDLRRFSMVMKRQMMENWKGAVSGVLVVYGILLAGLLVILVPLLFAGEDPSFQQVGSVFSSWFFMVINFGAIYMASRILKPCSTKTGCVSMLMLPASNFEKFVARVLAVSVGFFLTVLVALLAVSLTYYLLVPLFRLGSGGYGSLLAYSLGGLLPAEEREFTWGLFYMLGVVCWAYSVFVLGGVLWRRHAFGKALGVLIGAFFLFVISMGMVLSDFQTLKTLDRQTIETAFVLVGLFWWLCAVGNWIYGYRRFTRLQIVGPKRKRI